MDAAGNPQEDQHINKACKIHGEWKVKRMFEWWQFL